MGLVQSIFEGMEDEFAKRCMRHGEEAIMSAQPIEPLPSEVQALEEREAWRQYQQWQAA